VFDDSKGQKTALSGLDNFDDDLAFIRARLYFALPFVYCHYKSVGCWTLDG